MRSTSWLGGLTRGTRAPELPGYKQSPLGKGLKAEIFNGDGVDAPASTDWRESGAVTPVKDQG